jgi:LmbE family N-acetylglucosaminyl deacetylase
MKPSKRIRWSHLRRLYEGLEPHLKALPLKLEQPDSGHVLVLAPHIDDDIIGAGGVLRKHTQKGDEVTAVYLSDCTPERIQEGKEAAGIIGYGRIEFFEYPSKTLLDHREIPERLSALIAETNPDFVYLPSLFDRHNDHLAVNHHLANLFGRYQYTFTVYAYEVWTTLVPNVVVDISDTIDKKKEALACYRSQLSSHDWLEAAVCLNRYRAVASGVGEYAEGFMRYSMKEYVTLWKKMYGE